MSAANHPFTVIGEHATRSVENIPVRVCTVVQFRRVSAIRQSVIRPVLHANRHGFAERPTSLSRTHMQTF